MQNLKSRVLMHLVISAIKACCDKPSCVAFICKTSSLHQLSSQKDEYAFIYQYLPSVKRAETSAAGWRITLIYVFFLVFFLRSMWLMVTRPLSHRHANLSCDFGCSACLHQHYLNLSAEKQYILSAVKNEQLLSQVVIHVLKKKVL